jgi:hypothetical protein
MLIKLSFLSFLVFGVTYPLCFWISYKDPIKNHFLRFHLGCPVFLAGLAIVGSYFLPIESQIRILALGWLFAALIITAYFWNKETVNLAIISFLSLTGILLYSLFYFALVSNHFQEVASSVLAGLILSAAFYAMNLGHFYLNVHGLKLYHLINSVRVFGVLLFLRLLWDIYTLASFQMIYGGEPISLSHFLLTSEGIFLAVAFFFGVLFPLGSLFFAFGTLKLKNTQATTGILYVILSGVLLGDLVYKFYLLKYGIPL